MRQSMWIRMVFAMVACALLSVAAIRAEDAPPAPATPGGGRGNFDPAAFAKQREERMKTGLGVNDEEWKALQPKVDAVQKARRDSFGGGGGFGGRRTGQAGGTPDAAAPEKTDMQKKSDALRTLLENKDADPKAIQEALKAYRDERDKARETLKKAQAELKELLTAKQEAYMVLNGGLE